MARNLLLMGAMTQLSATATSAATTSTAHPPGAGPVGAKHNPATADSALRTTTSTSIDEWVAAGETDRLQTFEAAFANKYGHRSLDELNRDLIGEYYQGLDRVQAANTTDGPTQANLPTRHVHSGSGMGIDAYLNPSGDLSAENMMTQRNLGDCYYVAGITAVAAGEPQALKDAISVGTDDSGATYYDVRLHKPEGTTVDFGGAERFTFDSAGTEGRINSYYSGAETTVRVTQDEVEAWHAGQSRDTADDKTVSLLEVAMQRVIGFEDLNNGGSFTEAVYALTGRNGTTFEAGQGQAQTVIGDNQNLSAFGDTQWRDAARGVLDQGGFIGLSIAGRSPGFEANWDPDAPSAGHQYAVLEVTDTGLIMANPWGFVEPGAEFDPQNFDPSTAGDGVFYVPWSEAKSTFHGVSVVGGPSTNRPASSISGEAAQAAVLDRALAQYNEAGRPGGASDAQVRNHWQAKIQPEKFAELYFLLRTNPSADIFNY